jgi:hypothetical protein
VIADDKENAMTGPAGMLACWNCGASLASVPLPISRHQYCDGCGEPLHCCRQCRHFDPRAATQCAMEPADPPTNKESANFCDWFEPALSAGAAGAAGTRDKQAEAKAKLDALFGGSED